MTTLALATFDHEETAPRLSTIPYEYDWKTAFSKIDELEKMFSDEEEKTKTFIIGIVENGRFKDWEDLANEEYAESDEFAEELAKLGY